MYTMSLDSAQDRVSEVSVSDPHDQDSAAVATETNSVAEIQVPETTAAVLMTELPHAAHVTTKTVCPVCWRTDAGCRLKDKRALCCRRRPDNLGIQERDGIPYYCYYLAPAPGRWFI